MKGIPPYVQAANLIEGFPFPDKSFEVLYHSQVLEHIPKEKSPEFIRECFRVLAPGGIMRVVVPDLENIVSEYLKYLYKNLEQSDPISEANYDWMMLELFDQTVRNYSGGEMVSFLKRDELPNEDFVLNRIGFVGRSYRNKTPQPSPYSPHKKSDLKKRMYQRLKKVFHRPSKAEQIGHFRLAGEIHYWMYDRFSLARLLHQAGFAEIQVKDPFSSSIADWEVFELDVKNGQVFDPTSLFMEARKPYE
jgi:SAM-dependent methyltransferase